MKVLGPLCLLAVLAVGCSKAPENDPDAPAQEKPSGRLPVGTWVSELPDHPEYEFDADMHFKETQQEAGKRVEYSGTYSVFGDTLTMTRTSLPKMGEAGYNSETGYNNQVKIEYLDSKHMRMYFRTGYVPLTKK